MGLALDALLERIAVLKGAGDLKPVKEDWGEPEDEVGREILLLIQAPHLRPEHRLRIYEDLLQNRERLQKIRDARLVDLIEWSEHVETLHSRLRAGRLKTFYYARAMEATCRRCGFDFLPLVGKMEEVGRVWGGRDFEAAYRLLSAATKPPPAAPAS